MFTSLQVSKINTDGRTIGNFARSGAASHSFDAGSTHIRFDRRRALASLGALALSAAVSRGSPLAWAQQIDTPAATLSDLSMRRPPQRVAASSGLVWQGYAADASNVRAEPNTDSEITRELGAGESVVVPFFVAGEEVTPDHPVWAELELGQYVYSNLLRSNPAGDPPPICSLAPTEGRSIDVNFTLEVVTAYEGQTPVTTFLGSTGQPGWETPAGLYTIIRRVENERMVGPDYDVPNVKWTQYFTNEDHALHGNITGVIPTSWACRVATVASPCWTIRRCCCGSSRISVRR